MCNCHAVVPFEVYVIVRMDDFTQFGINIEYWIARELILCPMQVFYSGFYLVIWPRIGTRKMSIDALGRAIVKKLKVHVFQKVCYSKNEIL